MAKGKRIQVVGTPEQQAAFKAFEAQQARQKAHIKAAIVAGKSAQASVVAKVTDEGDVGSKLQGIALDGVKSRAERTDGAVGVFTVVNAQNRQAESMVRYLWAKHKGLAATVLTALEPMAQGHAVVWESMNKAHDKKTLDLMKKGEFVQAVSDAMRDTIWAK